MNPKEAKYIPCITYKESQKSLSVTKRTKEAGAKDCHPMFDVTEKRTSISAGEKDKPDQEPTPLPQPLM